MEQETAASGTSDPAAMAFDALRCEVTTLRLAVQQLAAAPTQIDIPDYTDTLADIRGSIQVLANHYRTLSNAPALSVTPDQLAAQFNSACANARKADRQSLQNAENSFVNVTRELTGFVESARTADKQNKWMLACGGLCFVSGCVVIWVSTLI